MYPVAPRTPDSASILIGAAAQSANDRRNKTLMNCFRDRTPRYSRSSSRDPLRYGNSNNTTDAYTHKPEATVVLLKEPRLRVNKLTLLKSSSARDLSRLLEQTAATSSTSSSNHSHNGYNNCDLSCVKRMQGLEQRLSLLDKELSDQRSYTKDLERKVIELTQQVDELNELRQAAQEKPKKNAGSFRKKKPASNSTVQPSKLVAWMKLSNLWKHRPSIQTLKEQNIYNDEPCFDTEIEMVLKHEVHKTVPKIIVDCCDLIEEKYRKSTEPIEGIYRQCGDYNKIQSLRFKIDANDYEALRGAKIDIHTLTGVLKLFLREIKSPLVSNNEAKTFIGKPNHWLLTDLATKIETLKRLIRSLPEVNRDTMQYLFTHFHRLTKIPLQSVSADILSLSVTPSIFHTVQQGVHMQDIHVLLKESEVLADCVKLMIEYHGRIFECTAERRKRLIDVRKLRKTLSHPDLIFQNLF